MRQVVARTVFYLTVALLAWGATAVMRPIETPRVGDVISGARVAWVERTDSLGKGETITSLLGRSLPEGEVQEALGAAPGLDPRRLRAGMRITLGGTADSAPSQILLHLGVDRLLRLTRGDSGWTGREETLPWTRDTLIVSGTVEQNLYEAFAEGARELPTRIRSELAWSVADVFEYRMDMSRDLQPGDGFRVLVERERTTTGAVRLGDVLGVDYTSRGERLRVVRYLDREGQRRYFDADGRSMQAMFLRAPLEFRRISSVFGMRRHPVLGIMRRHRGTDYAAPSGTPVRAIGDGVIITAGRMSGFGNVVEIRHPNGFVTRYGHLRGFAEGARRGARVSIGSTIGYVGMTGLASGPHLHFEVLVNGEQRDPRSAFNSAAGLPLAASERGAFDEVARQVLALLDTSATPPPDGGP